MNLILKCLNYYSAFVLIYVIEPFSINLVMFILHCFNVMQAPKKKAAPKKKTAPKKKPATKKKAAPKKKTTKKKTPTKK